jgi:hypothetical protein
MGKVTLLAGLAAGYVLGTRDGRERYEQIRTQATKVMQDPRVKRKATQAQDKVSQATHRASGDTPSGTPSSGTGTSGVTTPSSTTPSSTTPSSTTPSSTTTPSSASDVAGDTAADLGSESRADTGSDSGTVTGTTTAPGATDPIGGRDV